MKRFAVIGLGRFGRKLAIALAMSGAEVIKAAQARDPSPPALLISAFPRDHFPELGGAAFLQKPFRPETFLNEVRTLLDHPSDGEH